VCSNSHPYGKYPPSPNKYVPAHQKLFGEECKFARCLHTFGEVGIVHIGETIQSKLEDRGTTCIFVGYAPNHAANTYRMLNVQTRHVWVSRDVKWMKKVYGDFKDKCPPQLDEVDEDETISDAVMPDPDPPAPAPDTTSATQVNPKILKEMKKLHGWFNPDAEYYIAKASQATNTHLGREPAAVANAGF